MAFNEDSRVKIPAILHLMRLGYVYLSLKEASWDTDTNIFSDLFLQALSRINPDLTKADITRLQKEVGLLLDNEDLGQEFYKRLTQRSGVRLIDFENFDNNSFHVVTELPCINDNEEFRPDITLLVNGLPLVFIEVKKPNNREGILAERRRINTRFKNPKFKRFINATQLMLFSNNMEYDDSDPEPIQGAFYATTDRAEAKFNYFREEQSPADSAFIHTLTADDQRHVLKDTNTEAIYASPEFATNLSPDTPTNRLCTSLLCRNRLAFIIQYGITYVKSQKQLQKHVMRYPQIFATLAIANTLDSGKKSGIIWHTQGSGKTALAFFNVHYLTDYFQQRGITPKFYFIVDRLDLLEQAKREFTSRGLSVHTVSSKEQFANDIKSNQAIHNDTGQREITVVNIQKFKDNPNVTAHNDYDLGVQRIYFLDEVHRSYNPNGSFLANLAQSDTNAIKIGLTGTPLLGDDYNSRSLFGDYIHQYYYNASIADGYTLRLIRENIETEYQLKLKQALKDVEVQIGSLDRKKLYAHKRFARPMLDYIVSDFEFSRVATNDSSIGAMVICDSSDQARQLFSLFNSIYANNPQKEFSPKTAALILYDHGTKQEREAWINSFTEGKIDLLFVFNMLQTGFDAPRLKKLYLGRKIRSHNLLQTLTRVNRTYNRFRYGYVVDFADISQEFDQTNRAYFDELQSVLGDEMQFYSNLFKSTEEIQAEIAEIKNILAEFDITNAEIFSAQISQIDDRQKLLQIKKALQNAKNLYNVIRLEGEYELLSELDFAKLAQLFNETCNHLAMLNLHQSMALDEKTEGLLNQALEDTLFMFTKIGENELVLADKLKDILRKTREALQDNIDQRDPKFSLLKDELQRLFHNKNLSEVSQQQITDNIDQLKELFDSANTLNQQNDRLRHKYSDDSKYARLHKRILEQIPEYNNQQSGLFSALANIKAYTDQQVLDNNQLLSNESYFGRAVMPQLLNSFKKENIQCDLDTAHNINQLLVNEYTHEYNTGATSW